MNKLEIFKNEDFGKVRVMLIGDEPWFVGNDIAVILGYAYPKNAVRDHVDDEDKKIVQLSDIQEGDISSPSPCYIKGSKITIINESGMYSLILRSTMSLAKSFKRWVTSEVLPSIRKTGGYFVQAKDYPTALRLLADQVEAKEKALAEKAQAEAEKKEAIKTIERNQPKVDFADTFIAPNENNMLIRDVAKHLEQNGIIIAEKNLRLFLEDIGFMFRNGLGKWELYSGVVKKGYGVYRSYFTDEYTGIPVYQQTIYMTGLGYEKAVRHIRCDRKNLFLKYGKFV